MMVVWIFGKLQTAKRVKGNMPRVFRFPAERSWLELRRPSSQANQPKARLYPPQQVVNRWESSGGTDVLYELKTGDFARVEFSADGEFVDGHQIPRQSSSEEVKSFFEAHDLIMPFHLSSD